MLGWLAERDGDEATMRAAHRIEAAVSAVLAAGRALTPDLGGRASTWTTGDAVAAAL
jgi:3-isopropylmalate dehydrogenase